VANEVDGQVDRNAFPAVLVEAKHDVALSSHHDPYTGARHALGDGVHLVVCLVGSVVDQHQGSDPRLVGQAVSFLDRGVTVGVRDVLLCLADRFAAAPGDY
jgi:hypothetical protein